MYRSYTQIFRIFGAVIIFLWISKVAALFKIRKIRNLSVLTLSLTTRPRMSATQNRAHGGAADSGRPKRVDGETLARWTAPSWSTSPHEPIPTLRTAAGTPEEAPRRPWRPRWRGHGGTRHNSGYDAVETKAERASRSGAHREHDGVLG